MVEEIKGNKNIVVPVIVILFTATIFWWITANTFPGDVSSRLPGMDNRPPVVPRSDSVIIGELFDTLGDFDELVPGNWPNFRGPDYDNISKDTTPLAEMWDTSGPPVLWQVTLGEGYAGPVVRNGRVYILDYIERRKADALRCFSLKSGKELWRRWYYVDMKRNHGYSRTIPAVTDKYVVTIGPRSHVMCVDPVTGDLLWTLDMEKEFGISGTDKGKVTPDFFSGQCPLIDNDVAVLAPGAKALMIGVDCATGKVIWQTPNPDSLQMSHCSIIPMEIAGKRMYVYNALGGVAGVSAEGDDIGRLLWVTTDWKPAVVAASTLYIGNNEIAVFGSYGAGGAKIRITRDANGFSAAVSQKHLASEGIASDQQTPILTGGNIWSVMPENAGILKKQLVCFSSSDLLKPVWTSGKENRYGRGLGPYILSGNKLFLLDDDGKLYYFRISSKGAELVTSHKVIDGIEAWGPMAIAGRHLLMRDSRNLLCLDIGVK